MKSLLFDAIVEYEHNLSYARMSMRLWPNYPFIAPSYTFRLSSNFTDLVYLTTISNVSHPPNLIICSTSTPFLCKLEANVLLNVGALHGMPLKALIQALQLTAPGIISVSYQSILGYA
jgi:hypothetical protein